MTEAEEIGFSLDTERMGVGYGNYPFNLIMKENDSSLGHHKFSREGITSTKYDSTKYLV